MRQKSKYGLPMCKDDPCVWESVGKGAHESVLAHIEENGGLECLTNKEICFFYYKKVTEELYGYLDANNYCRLPDCVVGGVWKLFPNPPGMPYTGYIKK